MMSRDVVFRLTVEKSPEMASTVSSFVSEVEGAYDAVKKQNQDAAKLGGVVPGMDIADVRQSVQERIRVEREAMDTLHTEKETIAELEERVEADRRANQLAKLERFTEERLKIEKDLANEIAGIKAGSGNGGNPDEAIQAAHERAAEKISSVDAKMHAERVRLAQAATKERLAILKSEAAGIEAATAKYESMQEQIRSAKRETLSVFAEIGSSIMTTARGFASLGLAGEEDMKKLVQGMMKVQGAFDIISGGIQTWVKIQQAIEGVRKTILLTAAAEEALAKAADLRAASQLRGGVTGGAARGVANVAASSAAGAAGAAGAGALSRSRIVGTMLRNAGTTVARGASTASAVAAPLMAGMWGYDLIRGGGTFQQGSMSQRMFSATNGISGRMDQFLGFDTAQRGAVESQDRLERQQRSYDQSTAMYRTQVASVGEGLGELQQGFDNRAQRSAATLSLSMDGADDAEKQKLLTEEILTIETQIAEVREAAGSTAGRFSELITTYTNEQLRLEQRKRDLAQEKAEIDRDSAVASLAASEQALRAVDDRIQSQSRQLMSMQESMSSGQQRFGLMDEGRQTELLDIFRRGQAGQELTTEELRALQQVGSDAADAIVEGQAKRRAEAAGASVLFQNEQEAIDKLERDITKNINVRADIKWEVEFDQKKVDEAAAKLQAVIKQNIDETFGKLEEVVVNGLAGQISGVNTRIDGVEQRLADGAGGRN